MANNSRVMSAPVSPRYPGFAIACRADQPPVEAAEAVTRASGSNLNAVGRFLPATKRRLFEACYAGMRVVDDLVDDGFLALAPADRAAERTAAHRAVDGWHARAAAALAGADWRAAVPEEGEDPLLAAGAAPLFDALAAAVATGAPGPTAWDRLARAMHRDIDEEAIADWSDFDAYCEGATVAPAMIFLHVLTARMAGGRLVAPLSEEALFAAARPMALFCYLVHIQRDLAKDAGRGGQLVTLPADRLARVGLDRAGLGAAVAAGAPAVHALAAEIHARAGDLRPMVRRARDDLAGYLGLREKAILAALIGVYERLHDRLADDPGAGLTDRGGVAAGVVEEAFAASGLADLESRAEDGR